MLLNTEGRPWCHALQFELERPKGSVRSVPQPNSVRILPCRCIAGHAARSSALRREASRKLLERHGELRVMLPRVGHRQPPPLLLKGCRLKSSCRGERQHRRRRRRLDGRRHRCREGVLKAKKIDGWTTS
eukprot:scaffold161396_cov30-Tisochrysis_lutea.AAC.10